MAIHIADKVETKLSQPLDLTRMTLELIKKLNLPDRKEASKKSEENLLSVNYNSYSYVTLYCLFTNAAFLNI